MSVKALTPSSLLVSNGIVYKAVIDKGLVDPEYPEYRVSFGHLEAYLQSVRKDIYDQKCELQLCVSESQYKQEVAQRADLQQRVETCLLDLNLVKDLVFQNNQSPSSNYSGRSQPGDKTLMLKGEIENLKCVMRRFELDQCESQDTFSRLKRLENAHQQLLSDFTAYRQSDIFAPVRELIQQTRNEIETVVETLRVEVIGKCATTDNKVFVLDNQLKTEYKEKLKCVEEDLGEVAHRLKQVEIMFNEQHTDLQQQQHGLSRMLAGVSMATQQHASILTSLSSGVAPSASVEPFLGSMPLDSMSYDTGQPRSPSSLIPSAPSFSGLLMSPSSPSKGSGGRGGSMDGDSAGATSPPTLGATTLTYTPSKRTANAGGAGGSNVLTPTPKIGERGGMSMATATSALRALNRMVPSSGTGAAAAAAATPANIEALKTEFASAKAVDNLTKDMLVLRADLEKEHDRVQMLQGRVIFNVLKKVHTRYAHERKNKYFHLLLKLAREEKERILQQNREKVEFIYNRLMRVSTHQLKLLAFNSWNEKVAKLKRFEKIRLWCRAKLTPYWQSYQPDMHEYLDRWKQFVVDSYKGYLFDGGAGARRSKDDWESKGMVAADMDDEAWGNAGPVVTRVISKEEIGKKKRRSMGGSMELNRTTSLDLVSGANFSVQNIKQVAYGDMQLRWAFQEHKDEIAEMNKAFQETVEQKLVAMLGGYKEELESLIKGEAEGLIHGIKRLEEDMGIVKKQIQNSINSLSEEKLEIYGKMDSQISKLTQALNQYKSQVTVKLSYMKEELDDKYVHVENDMKKAAEKMKLIQTYMEQNDEAKEKFRHELALGGKTMQALAGQCEDIQQYLVVYKEQAGSMKHDIQLLVNKHIETNNNLEDEKKANKEQHTFFDEELKWVKNIITEQYKSLAGLRDATQQQFNSILIMLNQQDDPECMLGEYTDIVKQVTDLGMKFIYYQYSQHYVLKRHLNNHHKTMLTKASSQPTLPNHQKKYTKEYYEIMLSLSKLSKKIHNFMTVYADQEFVLHYINTYLQSHSQHLHYDYNNHFLQMFAKSEVVVQMIREKLYNKFVKEVEQKLMIHVQSSQHEEFIALHLPPKTPFTVNTKEIAQLKSTYMYSLRNALGCFMTQYHPVHLPTLSPLLTQKTAIPPNLAPHRHSTLLNPNQGEGEAVDDQVINAYHTYRQTSPPRKIMYTLPVHSSPPASHPNSPPHSVPSSPQRPTKKRPQTAPLLIQPPSPHPDASNVSADTMHSTTRVTSPLHPPTPTPTPHHAHFPSMQSVVPLKPSEMMRLHLGSNSVDPSEDGGDEEEDEDRVGSGLDEDDGDAYGGGRYPTIRMNPLAPTGRGSRRKSSTPSTLSPTQKSAVHFNTHNVALNTLVSHTAVQQKELVDMLTAPFAKDVSIISRHMEGHVTANIGDGSVSISSRPLVGKNQTK